MFRKELYADVVIIIHGEELPAHHLVICSQSGYFEKAFQDAFIEGERGRIEFNDDSAAAHWRVMEYLYTGDYGDEWQSDHFEGKESTQLSGLFRLIMLQTTQRC